MSAAEGARDYEALHLQLSELLWGFSAPPPLPTHPILPFPETWTELIALGLIGMTAVSVINHRMPHSGRREWGMGPGRGKWQAGRGEDTSEKEKVWEGVFQGGPPPLGFSLWPSTQFCRGHKPGIGVSKAAHGAVLSLKGK